MKKFNIPKREYAKGPKKMISWRVPEALSKELDKLADEYGWTTTDLAITALDQFVQWSKKSKSN